MSSPCDAQPCLGKLKELADAKDDEDAAWDDLLAAATAAGFAGVGSAALIFWIVEKAAETAIPEAGLTIYHDQIKLLVSTPNQIHVQ